MRHGQIGKVWVPYEEIEDKLTSMMSLAAVNNANQLRMFVVDEVYQGVTHTSMYV
jgi:hypothetical protein